MIRLLLPLLLILPLGTGARAQNMPITYEKQFIGYRFMYDNLVLKMPNFRRAMNEDTGARDVLRGSGALQIGGDLLVTSGVLMFISTTVFSEDNGLPNNNYRRNRSRLIIGSLAGVALGSYVIHLADKKRVRAVNIYNQNLPNAPTGYRPSTKMGTTPEGIGLLVNF